MHTYQNIYRKIFDTLLSYEGMDCYRDILKPWFAEAKGEQRWFQNYKNLNVEAPSSAIDEDLWRLYAFQRVNEILLFNFQQSNDNSENILTPDLTLDQYGKFIDFFGFHIPKVEKFHPFYHEIVNVIQSSDDNESISLQKILWPCITLGYLLISRAGCIVKGGKNFIHKDIAEKSTLYWAYRRKNRPTEDLSLGWGSNSQWRTHFRRDYKIHEKYYYNIDRKILLNKSSKINFFIDGLTFQESQELILNRNFIKTRKNHKDLFPYNYSIHTT